MSKTFSLEDPGEGIHEAEVVEVLVAEGDSVEENDSVMVVTTDKADSELPSPYGGTVQTVHVDVGDIVEVGDPLVTFADGDDGDGRGDGKDRDDEEVRGEDEGEQKDQGESDDEKDQGQGGDEGDDERDQGEVEEQDEAERDDEHERDEDRSAQQDATEERPRRDDEERAAAPVAASPSTRRLARELGVDLDAVDGSGPGGRILSDDVRSAAESGGERDEERPEQPEERQEREEREEEREEEQEQQERERAPEQDGAQPLRGWRRATANRVSESWQTIPHVTHMDRADITELEAFRTEQAPELTMTAFFVKAVVGALSEHPRFNATFRDDRLAVRSEHHVGVAVDTDRGLVVPVLSDADRRSLRAIGDELAELGDRARSGSLERDDVSGGTFTITNVGPLGGTSFTPIIVPPQVAILGLARAARTPVVTDDDEIVVRTMLPICLAFDHRINDGADAARFVSTIVALLEDPDELLLRS